MPSDRILVVDDEETIREIVSSMLAVVGMLAFAVALVLVSACASVSTTPPNNAIAIVGVTVIDPTSSQPSASDQTILVSDGVISAVGPSASVAIPAGAKAHGEVTTVDRGGKLREKANHKQIKDVSELKRLLKELSLKSVDDGGPGKHVVQAVSFEPGRRLELERNPHYWRAGYPRSEGIVFRFGVSPEEIRDDFLAGRLSFAWDLLPADAETFRHDPRFASG